jgi:hypothetical protein
MRLLVAVHSQKKKNKVAGNLRILCMVCMVGQIMSGTQELSQNNTPEPFNRVLEAFFDP